MTQQQAPNILFILADDHGYGDISAHGGPHVQTPHIDALGSAGISFRQFYANSTVCSPSRAALLTGRYPDLVGVPGVIRWPEDDSWGYLDPRAVTLPDMLRRGGYHTSHIGKWHLGFDGENHPCDRGFDTFRGFLGDMMDDYFNHLRHGRNFMRHDRLEVRPEGHATDIFTDWTIDYLQERAQQPAQPFFCYLAYNAPHTPIQPPEDWVERVRQREGDISEKRARYVALVEHMDDGIGRVLTALDALDLADNTLVIYASDNGGWLPAGASNLDLRGGKVDMYEGGIRVPCCARWPGRIPAGQVSDHVGLLMDWFATCCEVADVAVTHEVEAQSMLPVLQGGALPHDDRFLYWVRREGWGGHDPRYLGNDYHAVRRQDMKLLHNDAFAPLELFDLAADPGEHTSLDLAQHPQARDLCVFMQQQIQEAGRVPWQPPRRQGRRI